MHILKKPGPDLYIADWLSHHNHIVNRDQEISGMNISIYVINITEDIPICMLQKKALTDEDGKLQMFKRYIIRGWPQTKEGVEPGVETYS